MQPDLTHLSGEEPDFYEKLDISCKTERFGGEYGGWNLIEGLISSDSVVYSAGIGTDVSFDTQLIKQIGVTVHGFDPTPESIDWIDAQELPRQFIMHPYGMADYDGEAGFYPPHNPDHISHTLLERPSMAGKMIYVPVKRLTTIMLELQHEYIDLLKLDIEGGEYSVIDDLLNSGIRPKQLLVEFHHRFPSVGIEASKRAIMILRESGYNLFSISASNEEYCFVFSSSTVRSLP